jgi:hypothetical protein
MSFNDSDDLFNGALDSKMDFNEAKATNNDGIYRVSMALAKTRKRMEIYRKISSKLNSRR